jgi:hypothetical protein
MIILPYKTPRDIEKAAQLIASLHLADARFEVVTNDSGHLQITLL